MHYKKILDTQATYGIIELAAWPDVWVLRGETVSPVTSHTLYGYDLAANRLVWSLSGLLHGPITWHDCPTLVRAGDVAIAATYVGKRRDQAWLLGLVPQTGELLWRRPVAWHRGKTSGGKLMETAYAGLTGTEEHIVVFENRDDRECEPVLCWLDPANGESVYECAAPEIEAGAVVAGGYLYFRDATMGHRRGLYRVPAQPGGEIEKLLDTRVGSLFAVGDRLYGCHSPDLTEWTVACWDVQTFAEQASQRIVKDTDDYNWIHADAALPGGPHRIIIHHDEAYRALNLNSGRTLWSQTFEHGLFKFAATGQGMLIYRKGQPPVQLDPATGERASLDIDAADAVFVVRDRLAVSKKYFSPDFRIYVAQDTLTEATVSEFEAARSRQTALRDLLPDLLTDPRDELEALFTKAAERRSLTSFFKALRPLIGAPQIHKKVKDYLITLKAGELHAGPLNLTPFVDLHRGCFYYPDLFSFGPEDRFFPGVLFASETYGVEFFLMFETGQVISLHHDATFFEVAHDVWNDCGEHILAFERRFPQQGALLDIAQLMRFQQTFEDCDRVAKLGDLDPRDFFTRTAQALGWTLGQFQDNIEDVRLEFLYHYYRDYEDVLATMIEEQR
jgi:hypothetical protein